MSNDRRILDRPPLLESFNIFGLHDRKDIRFSSDDSVSILMARNGSGKTTLLAAIHAVLTNRFYNLFEVSFDRIEFKFRGQDTLTISRLEIDQLNQHLAESPISRIASECNLSIDYVMDVAQSVRGNARFMSHPGMNELYNRHPTMVHKTIYDALMQSIDTLYESIPILKHAEGRVRAALEGYEVVYLPTYRRIEMSLNKYQSERRPTDSWDDPNRRNINLLPSEIKFGLSDITDRLQEIFLEIQRKSNTTYQKISANIIVSANFCAPSVARCSQA